MYELKQGTERLTYALYNRSNDPEFIARLSRLLNYVPGQLSEDIQALKDYITIERSFNNG